VRQKLTRLIESAAQLLVRCQHQQPVLGTRSSPETSQTCGNDWPVFQLPWSTLFLPFQCTSLTLFERAKITPPSCEFFPFPVGFRGPAPDHPSSVSRPWFSAGACFWEKLPPFNSHGSSFPSSVWKTRYVPVSTLSDDGWFGESPPSSDVS
jgi:hypothetical protein